MLKNLRKQQTGFTIIEVMIVLVIAAVILLIVFLAVPALQRNSRNTQLKNDVAAVLAAATEFQNNNNGAAPNTLSQSGQDVTITCTGAGCPGSPSSTQAKVSGGTSVSSPSSFAQLTATSPTSTISIYFNRKCSGNAFASGNTNRAVAAGYMIEGGGSNSPQCQES